MLLLFSTMRRVQKKRRGTRQLRVLLFGVALYEVVHTAAKVFRRDRTTSSAAPRAGLFHSSRHGTCLCSALRGRLSLSVIGLAVPASHFPEAGIFQQGYPAAMFWAKLIRYVVLAGEIALAAGIAAIITMVLRYVIASL
jgi:hypothetical protein